MLEALETIGERIDLNFEHLAALSRAVSEWEFVFEAQQGLNDFHHMKCEGSINLLELREARASAILIQLYSIDQLNEAFRAAAATEPYKRALESYNRKQEELYK